MIWLQLSFLFYCSESLTRTFHIAAVEKEWDYGHRKGNSSNNRSKDSPSPGSAVYRKAVYVEYTDTTFTRTKPQPEGTGLLGPTIRVETFDTVVIHFKNFASIPYNLHGVGVSYGKNSEGAGYEDATSQLEKNDDVVGPRKLHTYVWKIPKYYGPTDSDPTCVTSAYYSHSNYSYDSNAGMVGPILICKPGSLSQDGYQYDVQEKILLFAVFDERNSHYSDGEVGENLHTINGYTNSTMPELILCQTKPLSLHLIGFGKHNEVHSISLEGHSFVRQGHRVTTLPVTALTFITASIQPSGKGVYSLFCQTPTHPTGRMAAQVKVVDCAEEPVKQMRVLNAYGEDEDEYEYYQSTILELNEELSSVQVRSHGKHRPFTWTHYIAALEVQWAYHANKKENSFRYTKVVYREFTDSQFVHPKISELAGEEILGPVLKGEVGDQIQIVFRNMAHHPFNLYPQGLSSIRSEHPYYTGELLKEYPIYPNKSITYIWKITKDDGPASSDLQCLTRYYFSSLHPQRDLASGLIGPLLICPKRMLNQHGNQIVTDKEHFLVFSVFDESLSWYQEENFSLLFGNSSETQTLKPKPTKQTQMHTINGIMSSLQVNMCLSEVSVWHILNLAQETELLSIQFGGNTFLINSNYQDTLTLFPLSGETIVMVMEKPGSWSVAPLDTTLVEMGMSASLRVSKCGHILDGVYQYAYEDYAEDFLQNNLDHMNQRLHKLLQPRSLKQFLTNDTMKKLSKNGDNEPSNRTEVNGLSDKLRNDYRISGYYDDYSSTEFPDLDLYEEWLDKDPRSQNGVMRTYFIAAVEVTWNYGFGNHPYFIKEPSHVHQGFPWYKKVIFREYLDSNFMEQAKRGERDAHLGLLGPYVRAEINDEIMVHFKNMASRPYSFYCNILPGIRDEGVLPQHSRIYTWKITTQMGPVESETQCRAWLYTSNFHSERDLHSGLLGPFLVCRPQVLSRSFDRQVSFKDFSLHFMKIDETQSWYFGENLQHHCPSDCVLQKASSIKCSPPCTFQSPDAELQKKHQFYVINGHSMDTLPGLVLSLGEKIQWHLLNMGRSNVLAIHFHGNVLTDRTHQEHHLDALNLYPGVYMTLEMVPHSTGFWRVESEEEHGLGSSSLYLVYDPQCRQPLGFSSGKIKNSQISASGHYGSWIPSLARLGKSGSINAWSVENVNSWIQVDLLTPTLVHEVHTQGARQRLLSLYVAQFVVLYSLDGKIWREYQGNARGNLMVFFGNVDSSSVRVNIFDPPVIARFLRILPTHTGVRAALRMELFGCDITSCSLPLGLQTDNLNFYHLSASSYLNSVFSSWIPNLARLKQRGHINAWRPQVDRSGEWLQLDVGYIIKVTGIITQGARSAFIPMYVTQFSLSYSKDGQFWVTVQGSDGYQQIFSGNQDSDTPFWITIQPPLVTRFLRLHPEKWKGGIALRMEVLGCKI
ncbi:coagulation factor VIII [Pelodytes ibericus]